LIDVEGWIQPEGARAQSLGQRQKHDGTYLSEGIHFRFIIALLPKSDYTSLYGCGRSFLPSAAVAKPARFTESMTALPAAISGCIVPANPH